MCTPKSRAALALPRVSRIPVFEFGFARTRFKRPIHQCMPMATTGQDQNAAGAPYRIEPVKPTGIGSNRRIQFSELAPDEEVIGIVAYDVLTSHLVDAGSGGRMAFRGDNDKHSVQLETVYGVMAKACMELARKMEVAQNSLFSICNCSADPTSMQGRAMNPNMELDGEYFSWTTSKCRTFYLLWYYFIG